MSILQDNFYEDMDVISQLTMPYESEIAQKYAKLPNLIPLDFSRLSLFENNRHLDDRCMGVSIRLRESTLSHLAIFEDFSPYAHYSFFANFVAEHFTWTVIGNPIVDFGSRSITNGSIAITKSKSHLDEQDIKKLMYDGGHLKWSISDLLGRKEVSFPRTTIVNNLAHFFNIDLEEDGRQMPSLRDNSTYRQQVDFIRDRMPKVFSSNALNIRNVELSYKVCHWIKQYAENGCATSWANLCTLKAMTFLGKPIYSIKERR